MLAVATFYTINKTQFTLHPVFCTVIFYSQSSEGLPQESGNTSKYMWSIVP